MFINHLSGPLPSIIVLDEPAPIITTPFTGLESFKSKSLNVPASIKIVSPEVKTPEYEDNNELNDDFGVALVKPFPLPDPPTAVQ